VGKAAEDRHVPPPGRGAAPAPVAPAAPDEGIITLVTLIIAAGFIVACIYHYLQGTFFGYGYPFNTFLFDPRDQFNDFFHTYRIAEDHNPYFTSYRFQGVYYPFTYFIVYFFTLLRPPVALLLLSGSLTVFLVYYNWQGLGRHDAPAARKALYCAILTFMGFPYLFLMDRGNTDIFILLTLGPMLILFLRKQWHASAVMLGLAAAFKLYPAVLGLLFLAERRYKAAFTAFAAFLVATLVGLLSFKGSFGANLSYVLHGFGSEIQQNPMLLLDTNVLQRSITIFSLVKWFLIQTGLYTVVSQPIGMRIYVAFVGCVFLFVAWYVVFREQRLWRRVFLLTIASILLPHVSGDHRLVLLYLPFMLFIREASGRLDRTAAVLFALLMVPKAYYFMYRTTLSDSPGGVAEGVVINPLLLIALGGVILYGGWREWTAGSATRTNSD